MNKFNCGTIYLVFIAFFCFVKGKNDRDCAPKVRCLE